MRWVMTLIHVSLMAGSASCTNQSTAVMPPNINSDKVKSQCTA